MLDQSRLEATEAPANPIKPRRKPLGPTFWKLFTAFLFFGPALAVFLLGYLIFNAVAGDETIETVPIQAPAEEAAPSPPQPVEAPADKAAQPEDDVIYQDESGTWVNTKRGAAPGPHIVTDQPAAPAVPAAETGSGPAPDLLSLGLNMLTGGGAGQSLSGPATAKAAKADQFFQDENGVWRNTGAGGAPPVQSEHIYQDKDGVWRNLSHSAGPDSASPAPVAADPVASVMSSLVSRGGETAGNPADMLGSLLGGGDLSALMGTLIGGGGQGSGGNLSGLMGALMGGGGQGSGGDLSGLMGALMGGGGQGSGGDLSGLMGALMGGGGQGSGGDLSSLMGALMGGSQGSGDLSGLMNGLMSSMAPAGSGNPNASRGVEESAPLNITRVRPQSFDSRPAQPQASQITSSAPGLNLEGYERFDPAKAGQVKSDWEFFDDPR